MTPTKIINFIVPASVIFIALSTIIRADSQTPKIAPLSDMYIPQGDYKQLAPARPLAEYPLIKETPRSYLILFKVGTNSTIGLIPKKDRLNNPTANIDGNTVVIRSLSNTAIYEGCTPYDMNKRYDVVGETETGYKARFSRGDYSTVCELAKTSVVYISEADLRLEQVAARRIEQERIISDANRAADKHKRDQEVAAAAQQRRQELAAAELQRRQESAARLAKLSERLAEIARGRDLSAVDVYDIMGMQAFRNLIINSAGDPPPEPKIKTEHNVAELVEYINSKIVPNGQWWGSRTSQLIYIKTIDQWTYTTFGTSDNTRVFQSAVVFRPDLLNADKIMVQTIGRKTSYEVTTYAIVLYSRNNTNTIKLIEHDADRDESGSGFRIGASDEDDAQRLAKAFQELIIAYGGTGEMF